MNFTFCLLVAVGITYVLSAQEPGSNLEREIRRLDLAEAQAILRSDWKTFDKLTSEDFIVNSPRNEIVRGRDAVKALFDDGIVNYRSFTREIESVAINGEVAIVMGRETIVMYNGLHFTEQIVHRRYTNFWVRRNARWALMARHANIICP